MKRRCFFVCSMVLLFVGCAPVTTQLGQTVQNLSFTRDTKNIPAGHFDLDQHHVSVLFKVSHLGYALYVGRFNQVNGSLNYDNADISNSTLQVAIDANSIDTNNAELEEKLRGEDFFNVEQHPEITFTATGLTLHDDRHGVLTGDLALLGVTKPVTLDVVFNGGSKFPMMKEDVFAIGFSAVGKIVRSEFGMSAFVPLVGDEVFLEIHVEFHKK